MRVCSVEGCSERTAKAGHHLCYQHWKMDRDGKLEKVSTQLWRETDGQAPVAKVDDDESSVPGTLSSTKLGRHFGLSARRMNLILAELGWIEKYVKGWTPTDRGNQLGAEVREMRQSGVPFTVWPESILANNVLLTSVRDVTGDTVPGDADVIESTGSKLPADDFRERFPARFRATDGHMVRSRAEMLIDNWLYMQGIVHAVERKLPIEEDVYCDFYLPAGKVYIEFWGMEDDPKYAARKAEKQATYTRYKLNLVELGNDDIMKMDDVLPRLLLKFGVDCT